MPKRLLIVALTLLLAACSFAADKNTAEAAVERFHQMVAAGQFEEIYAQATPEFQRAGPRENAIALFREVRDRLGPVRQTSQQGWEVNMVDGGNVVTLTYETQFTQGRGTERFIFRVNGGSAQLLGYNINAPDAPAAPAPAPAEANAAEPAQE